MRGTWRQMAWAAAFAVIPAASTLAEDAGKITGMVKYDGKAPTPIPITAIAANPDCAKMHKDKPMLGEEWVVDKEGGLQWVFVKITNPPDKKYEPPKESFELDQEGCQYKPHVFGVVLNQELIIKNSDPTAHNVHGFPKKNKAFNKSQPKKNMQEKVKLDKVEVFPIKCDVHGWMQTWCHVVEHPFFAMTDATGKFEIKDVPPGEYELEFWHESGASAKAKVKVEAGKEAKAEEIKLKKERKRPGREG